MAKTTTMMEDFNEVLDMAAGADGGVTCVLIMQFIRQCEEEGNDIPFLRQFAKMCRVFKGGWPGSGMDL